MSINAFWHEQLKSNKSYYINLCKKSAKQMELNTFQLLEVVGWAEVIHDISCRHGDTLENCGIALPSNNFTWILKKHAESQYAIDSDEFDELRIDIEDMIDRYHGVDEDNLRATLLPLSKYVVNKEQFELFVEYRDILSFYEEYSTIHGVFVLRNEEDYLTSLITASPKKDYFEAIMKTKKKHGTFTIDLIEFKTDADARFYDYYLWLKNNQNLSYNLEKKEVLTNFLIEFEEKE